MPRSAKFSFTKFTAILFLLFELAHLLFMTKFLGLFELDVGYLDYTPAYPKTVGSFFMWVLLDILVLIQVIGLWFWDEHIFARIAALLGFSAIIVVENILLTTAFTIIGWPLWLFVILREVIRARREGNHQFENDFRRLKKYQKIAPFFIILTLIIPLVPVIRPIEASDSELKYNEYAGADFSERQELYLNHSLVNESNRYKQMARAYKGLQIEENKVQRIADAVAYGESDFDMLRLMRIMYFDNDSSVMDVEFRDVMYEIIKGARYWFTESGDPSTIFWTENHQLAYHTAELLAGQLLKEEIFTKSSLTGEQHVERVVPKINKFLDIKGRYGWTEWHSNTYLSIEMMSLLNLVDFCLNDTIATKAAMLLDLMCFDFANNYYDGIYATAQARVYGRTRIGSSPENLPRRPLIAEPVWILLGIGAHEVDTAHSSSAVFLSTSDYQPPAILENIAEDAKENNIHWESTGWDVADAEALGLEYTADDLMYIWSTAATLHEEIIDVSFDVIAQNNIDPASLIGPGIPDIFKLSARIRGISVNELAAMMPEISVGIGMEQAHIYTYRTPYYQLSGAQNYHKGYTGVQEQIWQATLSQEAYVFTNSPGGMDFKGGSFIGGWKPRAGFHENVGIIIYDRPDQIIESRIAMGALAKVQNFLIGNRPYNHAYFPRWAFDEVVSNGGWTIARSDGGYVALYSLKPTYWASTYELISVGKKNAWIVEMGSESEYTSFEAFIDEIKGADIDIQAQKLGYSVSYDSPSQDLVEFGWEGDLSVGGSAVNLSTEYRWDNAYSQTAYGSPETVIEFGAETLTLDFELVTRTYVT